MRIRTKLKRFLIVLLVLIGSFMIYVAIANRNLKHMTYRQKILKTVYPAFIWVNKLFGKNTTSSNTTTMEPAVSFYSLKDTANNGTPVDLNIYKGKKVLLVNTASNCGYTNQYADLEKLSQAYKDKLVVIGFPANDFKEQEKGNDEEIAEFCKVNFGVTFQLMKKSSVIKGAEQNTIFKWLSDAKENGWNGQEPTWNFCKYLVDENGKLTNFFTSSVEPFSDELINAIKK